jgi:hypothetical protein
MSDRNRQLAIRGSILLVVVVVLFCFSRYIPRPFTTLAPAAEDFDEFEEIYSSSDKLSSFSKI